MPAGVLTLYEICSEDGLYNVVSEDSLFFICCENGYTSYSSSLSDNINISDSTNNNQSAFLRGLIDTESFAELSFTKLAVFKQSLLAAIALSEQLTSQSTHLKTLLDVINISDTSSSRSSFIKILIDAITFADNVGIHATNLKTLYDAIIHGENLSLQAAYLKSLYDTISFSATTHSQTAYLNSLSDALTFSENIVTLQQSYIKNLLDTIQFNDVINNINSYIKNLSDTIEVVENLSSNQLVYVNSGIDIQTFSETLTSSKSVLAILQDAILFSELLSFIFIAGHAIYSLNIDDLVNYQEVLNSNALHYASLTDNSIRFYDLLDAYKTTLHTLLDVLTVDDTLNTNASKNAYLVDAINSVENLYSNSVYSNAIKDIINFIEVLNVKYFEGPLQLNIDYTKVMNELDIIINNMNTSLNIILTPIAQPLIISNILFTTPVEVPITLSNILEIQAPINNTLNVQSLIRDLP